MTLSEIIKKRVSTRTYNLKPVDDSVIHEAIDTAKYAPSGKNRQPWRVHILDDNQRKDLLNILQSAAERLDDYGSLPVSIQAIEQCSRVMFILNAFSNTERPYSRNRLLMDTQSIGAFIQNLLLLLTNKGISSLWINDVYYAKDEIEEKFHLKHELIAAITTGYSDNERGWGVRNSLEEILV